MPEICYLDTNRLDGQLPGNQLGNLGLMRKYCWPSKATLAPNSFKSIAHDSTPPDDLHLYDNKLDGSLPPELGNLELLRKRYFSRKLHLT